MAARKQGHRQLSCMLLLSILFAISPTVQGDCVDPENPNKKVRRGEKTTICMGVGPPKWESDDSNQTSSYVRYSFKPEADEYSRFTIPDSYTKFVKDKSVVTGLDNDITVFSSSAAGVSQLRKYYDSEKKHIFPHLSAIIDVKDGEVKGIAWDKACMFCSDSECEENTYSFTTGTIKTNIDEPTAGCFLEEAYCDKIVTEGGTECDLTLYVVWEGTDEKDNVLASSKFRFSSFTGKQVMTQFRDQLDKLNNIDFPWKRRK